MEVIRRRFGARMCLCSFEAVTVIMCFGGWGTELPVCLDEARSFTLQVKNANHIPDYFYKLLDLLEPVADECIAYPARTSEYR